jgi:hypothetical protein
MRWLGSCLLAGAAIVAGAPLAWLSHGAEEPAAPPPAPPQEFELRGAGSCAAAACHNGNGPRGSKGSEYTTWVTHDPHARAVEVLYDKRSQRIEKNRKRPREVDENHPESDPLCLNCHVQPGIETYLSQTRKLPRRDTFSLDDGVSCEACHGAAGGWLTQHYTDTWRGLKPEEKDAQGMRNTRDLRVRAELCVRCHVGEGDLDVNHDLIAAGHPRLNFEYSAFLANVPKHWNEEKDRAGRRDFEARVWAIGQAVSARVSLELLAHRADPGNRRQRWPEFAEYDCFACHHNLAPKSWRSDPANVRRRLTTPAWNTWYLSPALAALSRAQAEGKPDPLEKQVAEVRTAMSFFASNRADAARAAGEAAQALAKWISGLETTRYDAARVKPLVSALESGIDKDLHECNWDQAMQYYLALAAMRQSLSDQDLPQVPGTRREYLADLRAKLGFPRGYDSPRGLDPATLPKK